MQFLRFFSSWGAFSVSNLQTETHINCSKLPIFQTWWLMRRVLGILVWTLISALSIAGHAIWDRDDTRDAEPGTRPLSPTLSTGKLWEIRSNTLRALWVLILSSLYRLEFKAVVKTILIQYNDPPFLVPFLNCQSAIVLREEMGENGDGHNVVNGHNDPTQTLTRCHIKGNKM